MVAAREMYRHIDIDKITELSSNYIVRPNFHFSYQRTGLVWFTTSSISARDYIAFWQNNEPRQVDRATIEVFYNELKSKGIVDPNDELLEEKILSKQYPKLNVCPGILLGYKWSLEDAVALDRENEFTYECKSKIQQITSVYS